MNAHEAAARLGVSKRDLAGDMQQEHILALLVETYPQIQTRDWRVRVVPVLAGEDDPLVKDAIQYLVSELRFVPDGFVVEPNLLDFFEVEVYSPMPGDKLRAYAKFAIDLGFYGIEFSLFCVNKHGHINEVDLLPHYRDWLALAHEEMRA